MKKILFLIIPIWLFFTKISYAFDGIFLKEEIIDMSRILQAYALISAIIVAIAATIIVFRNAGRMKGGIFGTVLNYFGVGMIAILSGFIISSNLSFLSVFDTNTISNILFILGYILMAIAAMKMSKAIGGRS